MINQTLRKPSTTSATFKILFSAYVGISLALVFYVPTLVPGAFVASESYVFGYNNRIGFLLFISLTAIGSLWWRKFNLGSPSVPPAEPVHRTRLWIGMAVAGALCALIYAFTARLGHFGESAYLINRVEMASLGFHPYRDFEFAYGASFLYLPILFSRLLHLSIPNGYYFFWAISVVAGVWMLAEVINRIDCPGKHKNSIFLLLYLFLLPSILTTGLSYTGMRYLAVPLLALIVFQVIRDGRLQTQIYGSLLAPLFTLLLILISPELGIAFCLGISSYFFLFYLQTPNRLWLVVYGGMLLLQALVMQAASKFSVLQTLKSFAGGACAFPIVPAPHILILFFSVFVCSCFIAESLWKREFRSNSLLVLLVTFPSLVAALGRCDAGHVVSNVMGIYIVCMLRLSNKAALWKWYRVAFVVVFLVIAPLSMLLVYTGNIAEAIASRSKSASVPDGSGDAAILPAHLDGPAQAPFGYFVNHNPIALQQGYYLGTDDVLNPDAVAFKIAEIAKNHASEIVLPKDYSLYCEIHPESSKFLIRILFAYPFNAKAVHTESIYAPLCQYIWQNYSRKVPPQDDTFGYSIWTRK